jgi:hypothetical protein
MRPCPSILKSTAWESWIDLAPIVDRGATIDAFFKATGKWLAETPRHNGNLNDMEMDALIGWIETYQIDLIKAKVEEPGLNDDRLLIAFWSLVAGVAGSSVWAKLAISVFIPASVAVTFGLGLIALGCGAAAVLKASAKARRWRMLNGLDLQLEAIKQHRGR